MKYSAALLAVLYIIIRVVLFYSGMNDDEYKYVVSLNLLFIVAAISLALYANYKSGKENAYFPDEMKIAMRAVSHYAIILTLFTYIFYAYIDAGFGQRKMDVFRYELEQTDYSEKPDTENPLIVMELTKEEFIEKEMDKVAKFVSPFTQATLTLVGVIVAGLIYSLTLVFLRMKVLPYFFGKR